MTSKDQEQPEVTKSRMPTFKTIEEEAAFWDTHSSEEFADELTPAENVKFVKAHPKRASLYSLKKTPLRNLPKRQERKL